MTLTGHIGKVKEIRSKKGSGIDMLICRTRHQVVLVPWYQLIVAIS